MMNQILHPWAEELTRDYIRENTHGSVSSKSSWNIVEDAATSVRLATIEGAPYRIVQSELLAGGFSIHMLGAHYEKRCRERAWPAGLDAVIQREATLGRFILFAVRSPEDASFLLPVMTLLEDHGGNWHLIEVASGRNGNFWAIFTVAVHFLVEYPRDPARFDDYGDYLALGAPSIVQRHSTERLRKHIGQKVVYDHQLCTHCLRCATACNEMRAIVTDKGARVLGPSEDFCTNCGLCQKRCSYLAAKPKETLDRPEGSRPRLTDMGTGIYVYGDLAESYVDQLSAYESHRPAWLPYDVRTIFELSSEYADALPAQKQIRLEVSSDGPAPAHLTPLLVTASMDSQRGVDRIVLRSLTRAALVLDTDNGKIELEMARAAMRAGLQVTAVASTDREDMAFPVNDTGRLFHRLGQWRQDSLMGLWKRREADIFLAPFAERVPVELHRQVLEDTNRQDRILSPHILQALPFGKSPLLKQLSSELAEIFLHYPELPEAEARVAAALLEEIPRNSALLHARYRTTALASGHTACPTCAEVQVLSIPVYMAIAMSLARKEIPEVVFTCETGCMSETLNKVNEVAQKVPGGRTVFGGGFAFGEAIAMAEDRAVRMGTLKKGRRYVVSQGGDGGAVIGLPAWLNALRQQAFLIRQRHPNVLHFINITDTQVYSNTGGESSASSLLGMGTLTTPIGRFLLGNQKIQWTLINLAAEFPGILVGTGHSANKVAMQQFWQLADRLGQSAIRWDVTPCPETGKFFGDDPDDLAEVMAHAGMLPEVIFVGRFRKRIAPLHPEDRNRPYAEWRREPKPILYWLRRDPRYRPLLRKDPKSGEMEPRNATARFLIAQLESYRDQMNRQIDLETHLVRQAEEWVNALFQELQETWKRYRYRLDQFPYAVLFNRQGDWKPEYGVSLQNEMVRRVLGWDELDGYSRARDSLLKTRDDDLEKLLVRIGEVEALSEADLESPPGQEDAVRKILSRMSDLNASLQEEAEKLQALLHTCSRIDPVEEEIYAAHAEDSRSLPERRRKDLLQLLDRIIEERGLARMAELQQYRLAQQLKNDFLKGGGLIRQSGTVPSSPQREELRRRIAQFGPFAIGVASLAGDRGIAINRIFANFFTARGAWAGMAWQFGSSKRGTPVLSATFVDSKALHRKDAMYSFPMAVLTVTNFEEMKHQPDLFFDQLLPEGFLIVNHRKSPHVLWRELVQFYPEEILDVVEELRHELYGHGQGSGVGKPAPGLDGSAARDAIFDAVARKLWKKPYAQLPAEQSRTARKIAAIASVRMISVDMDGIMREVSGSPKVVSNLVAVAPMFMALQDLGFPLEWDDDRPILTRGFPAAVLKDKNLLDQYYMAMERARSESRGWEPVTRPAARDSLPVRGSDGREEDPGEHLMIMGGTLAGMVLSQIATAEHPLFYVGFPITPAGNPFYAMAEAFANGHPYIVVDEVNPSEKVAAEKLLGIARTGGFLPVTFTASQGWRLFTEIIPQFVGARLEGLFLIARRALAAPNLNIEESHTDFMSFRDDGGLMLCPKSIQEYVPALYLARLLTHYCKIPVILSIGGITDTHKIGLVKVPSDDRVRSWLKEKLRNFDFLEHKLLNRQGDVIVHGPSGTSAVYQETQSEVEKAHQALTRVYPYAVEAVRELTGVLLDEVEAVSGSPPETVETLFILQGSLFPNAVEALQELEEAGWSAMACLSIRCFNPFPEEKLFPWFERARRIVVFDRSNSFGSVPPLASRIFSSLARYASFTGDMQRKMVRTLVGGLGGREVTVQEMKEILLSSHLLFHPPEDWESGLVQEWLQQDPLLNTLVDEAAALDLRSMDRHTRVPAHLRTMEDRRKEYETARQRLVSLLMEKNYAAFLSNYHQVEFIAPREVLRETVLLQQIVLHVEMRLARHAIESGRGRWRHALLLMHYSLDASDHERAKPVLAQAIESGRISRRLGAIHGAITDLGTAEDLAVGAFSDSVGSSVEDLRLDAEPSTPRTGRGVMLDAQETSRIEAILTDLVTRQGVEPLFYNPEDFEHELLRLLEKEPHSALQALKEDGRLDLNDESVLEYRHCYRDVIDHVLHREILSQHHAPELRDLFEGEGLRRIEEFVRRLDIHLREEPVERKWKLISQEVERYLLERCLPHYPKSPLFYMEYFRNWVAPGLRSVMADRGDG